ncbi:MAG: asparagine synthase (glutamine-hydrolyzing) [Proteobacteria bacterium]|nr:asparagine synthase (glutamine-hydrolyzing) [Pseudomonadota bacterium]
MCGIAGILNFNGARTVDGGLLTAMRDSMVHRGPDGEGLWIAPDGRVGLAHRRLAIVDLSDAAAQPMSDTDETVWVTFNGEIYNHLDLRRDLEKAGRRFRTDHSDTEVLVHGYAQWGMDGLVDRLDGMFAFALWDEREKTLYIVRDRVGIKPVYFTRTAGSFRFASEIKAILTDPGIPRVVDLMALNHYLSFMVAPAPLTMFKDIFKLPPGHILKIDSSGRMKAGRYWDAVPGRGIHSDQIKGLSGKALEDFYANGIRQRLEASIEKRMMSDVPFGVFLSGGIDSSANVALMSRLMDRPVETFTVGFKDHTHLNELDYAQRVAKEFKTHHHEVLIDESDMLGYLDNLVHHQDEPIADWVCIPLYFVSKLAKDSGVTVVQVGEGSDEQFCGYDSWMTYLRLYKTFWGPYRRFIPAGLRKLAAAAAGPFSHLSPKFARVAEVLLRAGNDREFFWSGANAFWNVHKNRYLAGGLANAGNGWRDLAEAGLDFPGLGDADSGAVIDGFFEDFDRDHPGCDVLTRMAYSELRLRLPELLLMRLDKIAMSNSIEGRVPFLDHELVSFTMDIPMAAKVRNGVTKHLLKKTLGDTLPAEIIHRKKMGFAAPMAEWLRGGFGVRAEAAVLGSELLKGDIFDRDYIAGRFRAHREGRVDEAVRLWTLFNLAAWHEHWIEGKAAG